MADVVVWKCDFSCLRVQFRELNKMETRMLAQHRRPQHLSGYGSAIFTLKPSKLWIDKYSGICFDCLLTSRLTKRVPLIHMVASLFFYSARQKNASFIFDAQFAPPSQISVFLILKQQWLNYIAEKMRGTETTFLTFVKFCVFRLSSEVPGRNVCM